MDATERRGDELAMTTFRDHLAKTVAEVEHDGRRVYLTKAGRRVAAIVPVDDAEALDGAEDRYLAERAMAAKIAQGNRPYTTLDQLMLEYAEEHGEAAA